MDTKITIDMVEDKDGCSEKHYFIWREIRISVRRVIDVVGDYRHTCAERAIDFNETSISQEQEESDGADAGQSDQGGRPTGTGPGGGEEQVRPVALPDVAAVSTRAVTSFSGGSRLNVSGKY